MTPMRRLEIPLVLMAATLALLLAQPATAGCGCDHPPPGYAEVMPPFGSPGKLVRLHATGFAFSVGSTYEVEFENSDEIMVTAFASDFIDVAVPDDTRPGPSEIEVKGPGVDYKYGSHLFTALSPAPVIPAGDGIWLVPNFQAAVAEDGTMLIPFNLKDVLAGTQFMFQMGGVRLEFGHDDVIFYNSDGFDLTLFTLDVNDPTHRQWGSYHGWNVEQDTGITGEVYENKRRKSLSLRILSDMLTYWRHEFFTYRDAHLPGGSHEVGVDGYHTALGTFHVDHDHLVLALMGTERSFWSPTDPSRNRDLKPGSRTAQVFVATVMSDNPIEPADMESMLWQGIEDGTAMPMILEMPTAYDND